MLNVYNPQYGNEIMRDTAPNFPENPTIAECNEFIKHINYLIYIALFNLEDEILDAAYVHRYYSSYDNNFLKDHFIKKRLQYSFFDVNLQTNEFCYCFQHVHYTGWTPFLSINKTQLLEIMKTHVAPFVAKNSLKKTIRQTLVNINNAHFVDFYTDNNGKKTILKHQRKI